MRKTVSLTRIAAMTAVSLVVILAFGIFAIGMRYAHSESDRLQATASGAALAAAPELPNPTKTKAKALHYVAANMLTTNPEEVLDRTDVRVGNWDPVTETWSPGVMPFNSVKVTTRRSGDRLDLFLGPILGLGSLDMEASATSYFRRPTGRAFLLAGTPL